MSKRGTWPENGLKPKLWYFLLTLSELGALNTGIRVSTIEMAGKTGVSQQTASRQMNELEKGGYIEKQSSPQGSYIKITDKGKRELERVYLRLGGIIEEKPHIVTLEGSVFNGLGEGAYYVSKKGYKEQFLEKLGFNPFPGTLNLRLDPSQLRVRNELETYPGITIDGFKSGKRTFGRVKCFPAIINDAVEGAVALIDRTHHDDSVIELVAPLHLRNRLDLKEGSKVQVKIKLRY